jgi:streptogramin lyase
MVRGSRVLTPVLVTLSLLVSCSGGDGEPAEGPSRTGEPTSGSGATGPTAPPVEEVPLADLEEDRIRVDAPDRVLVGFGSIWVHTDDQRMVRIDPMTHALVARVDLPGGQCPGSGLGEGMVWACRSNELVGIDPTTNRVSLQTGVAMGPEQRAIGAGEEAVWVLDPADDGRTLLAVNPKDGDIVDRIPLGHACHDTYTGLGSVWVVCPDDGVVVRVDGDRRRVTGEVRHLPGTTIGVGNDAVWAGTSDPDRGLVRIDPRSLEVVVVPDTGGPGPAGAIWVDGRDVWVRSTDPFLTRIDARTRLVEAEVVATEPLGGGAVSTGFGSVWASSSGASQVLRLTP